MGSLGQADLLSLVKAAPFADEVPVAVAVGNAQGAVVEAASGHWQDGRAVRPADRFYGASLAKQVTGTAIAVLVSRGMLDPADRLAQFMPDLPAWAGGATILQLLGHTASFPAAGVLEGQLRGRLWTAATVLAALADAPAPSDPPGSRFCYSNAGYVVLAGVVERASGRDLASFAQDELFSSLALADMGFPPDTDVAKFAQVAGMGPERPLSHGDGGLWTTAGAFAKWLVYQNCDALGVSRRVETPARLSDGTVLDYGWGLGLRAFRGSALFSHGGSWRGACCKAVRSRALGLSIAAFAASDAEQAHLGALVDTILEACA